MADKHDTEELIRLSFFTDMAHDIASAGSLRATLDRVMKHIGRVFAPRTWSILLHDAQEEELEFTVVIGGDEARRLQGHRISTDTGIAGWIFLNGQPLIVSDVASDPRFDPSVDRMTGFTTRDIIGVPLLSRERVFGVIELVNKLDGERFTAFDLKVLSTIADFAGIAIEKAYYFNALSRVAYTDHLTRLANRRSISEALERELARCKRTAGSLAAMMIDINGFKALNDTHGHVKGDRVLQHLAGLLKSNVRQVDVVGRYGGDEFFVLMPDIDYTQAKLVAKRIERVLDEPDSTRPVEYAVSIGVFAGCPDTADELFAGADVQLYSEKERLQEATISNLDEHISRIVGEEARE